MQLHTPPSVIVLDKNQAATGSSIWLIRIFFCLHTCFSQGARMVNILAEGINSTSLPLCSVINGTSPHPHFASFLALFLNPKIPVPAVKHN